MTQIRLGDTQFYYESQGQGEPLVLIAGYSCDHHFWDDMVEDLRQHFQVFTFDNRGIGQTKDTTTKLTLELLADDTMALVNALGLKQPIILGQSMGGAIAQLIAQKYPKDISKLIILNSAAKINYRTIFVLESLLSMFKQDVNFDALMDVSLPWFYSDTYLSNPEKVTAYKKMCQNNPYPPDPHLLERQLSALKTFNALPWAHKLSVPTLVISSEQDILCLPHESEELANLIPKSRFVSISGGHSSPVENPEQVIDSIVSFCEYTNVKPFIKSAKR